MKLHLPLRLLASLTALFCLTPATTLATTSGNWGDVMYVGDSITHGYSSASYRWALHKILVDNGITQDEVGVMSGNRKNGITSGTTYRGVSFENVHSAESHARVWEISGRKDGSRFGDSNIENWLGVSTVMNNGGTYEGTVIDGEDTPETYIMMGGTNDFLSDSGAVFETVQANLIGTYDTSTGEWSGTGDLDTIVNSMREASGENANIIMLTIPTWSAEHSNNNTADRYKEVVKDYNDNLKEWAAAKGVTVVDVNEGLIDVASTKIASDGNSYAGVTTMYGDGLHPNAQGELLIAGNIARQLGYAGRTAGLERRGELALTASTLLAGNSAISLNDNSFVLGGSGSETASVTYEWGEANLSNGFTVTFSLDGGLGNGAADGTWDTANNLSLQLGDGSLSGTLNINEAYVQWGDSILWSEDMSGLTSSSDYNASDFRVAYVYGSVEENIGTGFYVWMGDMLIGEALEATEATEGSLNGFTLSNGTGSAITLSGLQADASGAYAPSAFGATYTFEHTNADISSKGHLRNDIHGSESGYVTILATEGTVTGGNNVFSVNTGAYTGHIEATLTGNASVDSSGYNAVHRSDTLTGDVSLTVSNLNEGKVFQSGTLFGALQGTVSGNLTLVLNDDDITLNALNFNNTSMVLAGAYAGVVGGTLAIDIQAGTYNGNIFGGSVHSSGDIGATSVTVSGGEVTGNIYGGGIIGTIHNGTAVTVTGGATVTGTVITAGGYNRNQENIIEGGTTLTVKDVTSTEDNLYTSFLSKTSNTLSGNGYEGNIGTATVNGTKELRFDNVTVGTISATLMNFDAVTLTNNSVVALSSLGGASSLTVDAGSTLTMLNGLQVDALSGGGTLNTSGHALTLGSSVTDATSTTTFSGTVSNGGTLIKEGAGTQKLTGSITFTDTTVNGGKLGVTGTNAASLGNITLGEEGTLLLDVSANYTYALNISGSGIVEKIGSRYLIFNDTNASVEHLMISAGKVALQNNTSAYGNIKKITVNNGTSLETVSHSHTISLNLGTDGAISDRQIEVKNGENSLVHITAATNTGGSDSNNGKVTFTNLYIGGTELRELGTNSDLTTITNAHIDILGNYSMGANLSASEVSVASGATLTSGSSDFRELSFGRLDVAAGGKVQASTGAISYNGNTTIALDSGDLLSGLTWEGAYTGHDTLNVSNVFATDHLQGTFNFAAEGAELTIYAGTFMDGITGTEVAIAFNGLATDGTTLASLQSGNMVELEVGDYAWKLTDMQTVSLENQSYTMFFFSEAAQLLLSGNSTDLSSAEAWVGGVAPAHTDTIRFTAAGTYTASNALDVHRMEFNATETTSINNTSHAISLGRGGIEVVEGGKALVARVEVTADQTWTVGKNAILNISDGSNNSGGGLLGSGAVTITGGGTVVLAANNNNTNTIDWLVTGGSTLRAFRDSAKGSLGTGTITLDNGTLGVNIPAASSGTTQNLYGSYHWSNNIMIADGGGTLDLYSNSNNNRYFLLSGHLSLAEGASAEEARLTLNSSAGVGSEAYGIILTGDNSHFTGTLVVNSGVYLRVGAENTTGSTAAGNCGTLTGGDIENNGTISLTHTGEWTVTNSISGSGKLNVGASGLTSATGQVVTLSGTSNYTGGTKVYADNTLNLTNGSAAGTGEINLAATSSKLAYAGNEDAANADAAYSTLSNNITGSGELHVASGKLQLNGTTTVGTLTTAANTDLKLSNSVIVNDMLTTSGALTVDSDATLTVNSAGTIATGTLSGNLTVGAEGSLEATNLTMNSGATLTVNGTGTVGTLQISGKLTLGENASLTVEEYTNASTNNDGTLTLSEGSVFNVHTNYTTDGDRNNRLNWGGTVVLNGDATLNYARTGTSDHGLLLNSTVNGNGHTLTKTGAGRLWLTSNDTSDGNNNYSNISFVVEGGELRLGGSANSGRMIPSGITKIETKAGTTLSFTANDTQGDNAFGTELILAGDSTLDLKGGASDNTKHTYEFAGAIELGDSGKYTTITPQSASRSLQLDGVVTGAGGIRLEGSGTMELSLNNAANSFEGGILVNRANNAATINLGAASAAGTGDIDMGTNANHVLNVTGNTDGTYGTMANKLSGSGKLNINSGKVEMTAGGSSIGVATVATGAALKLATGAELTVAELINNNEVELEGGKLSVTTTLTSTGSVVVASGAELEIGATTSQNIAALEFAAGAKLTLSSGKLSFTLSEAAGDTAAAPKTTLVFLEGGTSLAASTPLTMDFESASLLTTNVSSSDYTTIDVSSWSAAEQAALLNSSASLFEGVANTNNEWDEGQRAWIVFGEGNANNGLYNLALNELGNVYISSSANAIPEPTTATLSLLALTALCARRRRRA